MRRARALLGAFLGYCVLTAVVTYPQVTQMTRAIADHPDPYFSIWRLGWVAHAITRQPWQLFDANIFHPEAATFAYSDAMVLPAAALAPLFWIGVPAVTIYNLALLGSLALSGLTMFMLAAELSGSRWAGLAAGMIYAFAPYRLEQYIHLEMETVFWIPLAVLALHRLLATGRLRDGILFGLLVAAQVLSGIYGALCLVAALVLLTPLLWLGVQRMPPWRPLVPLAAAMAAAAIVVLPYSAPYRRVQEFAGPRGLQEIGHYEATLSNYLAATPSNRLYGWTSARFGGEELHLFPGLLAVGLGVVGLAAERKRNVFVYAAVLVWAFDAARGFDGWTYPLLYRYAKPFQGLRVPARFDLILNLALAVVAAYGLAWLLSRLRPGARPVLGALVLAGLTCEYAVAPPLAPVGQRALVDRWLASQPRGVVVSLPLPTPDRMWPNLESRFMFDGMAHWLPTVNGYSGFLPPSYLDLVRIMQSFPDDASIAYLKARQVRYIAVRPAFIDPQAFEALQARLESRAELKLLAGLPPPGNELVFGFREQ